MIGHYNSSLAYADLQEEQIIRVFEVGENCNDVALNDEKIYCSFRNTEGASQFMSVDVSTGNTFVYSSIFVGRLKLFSSGQRWYGIDSEGFHDLGNPRVFDSRVEDLWFSRDRKQFVSDKAQLFDVGVGETTKYVADLENIGSIVGLSHSQSTGNYLIISEDGSGVIFVDEETLERKETIPFPEIQVDSWTRGNLPKPETFFYKPIGRFVFVNNAIREYYVIVEVNLPSLNRDYAVIIDDF